MVLANCDGAAAWEAQGNGIHTISKYSRHANTRHAFTFAWHVAVQVSCDWDSRGSNASVKRDLHLGWKMSLLAAQLLPAALPMLPRMARIWLSMEAQTHFGWDGRWAC